jgi:pimeloyl-ACP methyl ester carboxylesterase
MISAGDLSRVHPLRRRLGGLLLALAGALVLAAVAEQWLEARDVRQLAPAETYVAAGGAKVRYRLEGAERPGPAVVLINGMGGSLEQWHSLQSDVASFAPALTYDRGGLGLSRGSKAHDGNEQADELASVLTQLAIKGPAVLVGYSTSASIARIFASRYPERVAGMLLLEPNLPEMNGRISGRHDPLRTYYRPLLQDTITSLFGMRRLSSRIAEWRGRFVLRTEQERKAHAVLLRFSHWWAVDREWMQVGPITRQVLEAKLPRSIPLLIYTEDLRERNPAIELYEQLVRDLVAGSEAGGLRSFGEGTPHGEILEDPRTRQLIDGAIRELTDRVRYPESSRLEASRRRP